MVLCNDLCKNRLLTEGGIAEHGRIRFICFLYFTAAAFLSSSFRMIFTTRIYNQFRKKIHIKFLAISGFVL